MVIDRKNVGDLIMNHLECVTPPENSCDTNVHNGQGGVEGRHSIILSSEYH